MPDTTYPSEVINPDLIDAALKSFLATLEQNISVQIEILQNELHRLQEEQYRLAIQQGEHETPPKSKKSKAPSKRPSYLRSSTASRSTDNTYTETSPLIQTNAQQIDLITRELDSLNDEFKNLRQRCLKGMPELITTLTDAVNKEDISHLYDDMLNFAEANSGKHGDLVEFYRGFLPKFNLEGDLEDKFPKTAIVYFKTQHNECPFDSKCTDALKMHKKQVINKERAELIKFIIKAYIHAMKHSEAYTIEQVIAQAIIFFWFLCTHNFNITLFKTILNNHHVLQHDMIETHLNEINIFTTYLNTKDEDTVVNASIQALLDPLSEKFNLKKSDYIGQYYTCAQITHMVLTDSPPLPDHFLASSRYLNDAKVLRLEEFMLKAIYLFMLAQRSYDQDTTIQLESIQNIETSLSGPIPTASCSHAVEEDNSYQHYINSTLICDYLSPLPKTISSTSQSVDHSKEILLIAKSVWDKFVGALNKKGFWERDEQQAINAKLLRDYLILPRHETEQQLYNNWHQFLGNMFLHLRAKANEFRQIHQDAHPDSMVCRPKFVLPISPRSPSMFPHSPRAACSSEGPDLASTPVESHGAPDKTLSPLPPKPTSVFFRGTRADKYKNTPPRSVMQQLRLRTDPSKNDVPRKR